MFRFRKKSQRKNEFPPHLQFWQLNILYHFVLRTHQIKFFFRYQLASFLLLSTCFHFTHSQNVYCRGVYFISHAIGRRYIWMEWQNNLYESQCYKCINVMNITTNLTDQWVKADEIAVDLSLRETMWESERNMLSW